MNEIDKTLAEIERKWLNVAVDAICDASLKYLPSKTYAAAFWLLYYDYTFFGVPCFAINHEEHLSAKGIGSRWPPPEWNEDVHDCYQQIQPLYTNLSKLLEGKADETWDNVAQGHYNALFRISKSLTSKYHSGEGRFGSIDKHPDFFVSIIELREPDEMYEWLLKNSVEEKWLSKAEGILL